MRHHDLLKPKYSLRYGTFSIAFQRAFVQCGGALGRIYDVRGQCANFGSTINIENEEQDEGDVPQATYTYAAYASNALFFLERITSLVRHTINPHSPQLGSLEVSKALLRSPQRTSPIRDLAFATSHRNCHHINIWT